MPAQASSETSIPDYRYVGAVTSGGSNSGVLIALIVGAVLIVAWFIYRGKN